MLYAGYPRTVFAFSKIDFFKFKDKYGKELRNPSTYGKYSATHLLPGKFI